MWMVQTKSGYKATCEQLSELHIHRRSMQQPVRAMASDDEAPSSYLPEKVAKLTSDMVVVLNWIKIKQPCLQEKERMSIPLPGKWSTPREDENLATLMMEMLAVMVQT
ncbi:hypothetical protein A4A49_30500 [Nicotiana attenuata]|uniref:Uncharacterized protein n=1 Tax=Nicotiana attenuata TaxID=49451 RepID=A0A1J6I8X3_NICAT|nr:hypothetical protein A4A49_30500 [Nicotiana attenuata]